MPGAGTCHVRCLVTGWGRATARGCGGWMRTAARSLPSLADVANVSFVVGSGLGSPRAGRFAVIPDAPRGSLLPAAQGLLRSPASAVGVEEGESGI